MTTAHPRFVASLIAEFVSDFIRFSVKQYHFSMDEIAIVSLVASESTRELRSDAFVAMTYGNEMSAIPNQDRPPVSLKFVHVSLGMSRETARRKLEDLVKRGYLIRGKGGYFLPAQVGKDDFTKEFRAFVAGKQEMLQGLMNKIPQ